MLAFSGHNTKRLSIKRLLNVSSINVHSIYVKFKDNSRENKTVFLNNQHKYMHKLEQIL